MKLIPIVIIILSLVIMSGCITPPTPPPPTVTHIYVFPSQSFAMLDDIFSIKIMCDATQEIKAWEATVRYNPNHIQPFNYTWGDIWELYPDVFYSPIVNMSSYSDANTITNLFAVLMGNGMELKKSGSLVTISFITDANGYTNIELIDVHLYNSTGEIPIEVTNGTIFVYG